LQVDFRINRGRSSLVSLEQGDKLLVIGEEICRAVVGHKSHAIGGLQTRPDKLDQLRYRVEISMPPLADGYQEGPVVRIPE